LSRRSLAVLRVLAGLAVLAGFALAQPGPRPLDVAANVETLERVGAYARALEQLQRLRELVPRDPDLELYLALYQARLAAYDSAAALLAGLPLTAAELDSQPRGRQHVYPWERGAQWTNGRYDGWSWYVLRARAEVAAALGRWDQAAEFQRRAAGQKAWAGKEWVLLGACQAKAGRMEEAERSMARGRWLDPSLPEAHYWNGLLDWRAGRRAAAAQAFAEAAELDTSFREAVIARTRIRLPGSRPDEFPSWLLRGRSAAALLTSPVRPKLEEHVEADVGPQAVVSPAPQLPAGLKPFREPPLAVVPVLVDENGRAVLNEPPAMDPRAWSDTLIHATLAPLREWRFTPAQRSGAPIAVWGEAVLRVQQP
jgi:tetratricopeptide (TPR) repeat protein